MSYEEYRDWVLFYSLEPWGWHNTEYILGSILAMLANVNRGKKGKAKKPTDFMRNASKELDKAIAKLETEKKFETMSDAERKDFVRQQAFNLFGVSHGNSGDNDRQTDA